MTDEILSQNTIASFYRYTELNMMDIAALWSNNTPLYKWPGGLPGALDKLPRPNEFMLKLDELSDAVARYKFAESLLSEGKDNTEPKAELLENDPAMYLVPAKFKKKRPLLRSVEKSPSDPKNFLPEPLKTTISRKELARYAIATQQHPGFLDRDIKAIRPEPEKPVPPYLDENHPNFARELYIAINLWQDLCQDLERMPHGGVIPFLEKELRKNYGPLSKGAYGRIPTLVNPIRFKRKPKSKSKKK